MPIFDGVIRRISFLAALVTLTAAGLATALTSGRPAAAAGLVVRVSGNRLVDGSGQPLRLLGVNRSGTEYACVQGWGFFDGPSDAQSISAIAAWHTNAVRVPLNEDCWLGINGVNATYGGTNYRNAVAGYVARLHAAGLVAVLDLHWNAPGGALATGQQVMADADHSPSFWSSVGAWFKNDPAVVFDLYNEPHDISWSWKSKSTWSSWSGGRSRRAWPDGPAGRRRSRWACRRTTRPAPGRRRSWPCSSSSRGRRCQRRRPSSCNRPRRRARSRSRPARRSPPAPGRRPRRSATTSSSPCCTD